MGAVSAGVTQYRFAVSINVYGDRRNGYEPLILFGQYFDCASCYHFSGVKRAAFINHASSLWSNL